MNAQRPRRHHPIRQVVFGVVALLALTSCDAGWVNPFVGSGTNGTTNATVPDSQAELTTPTGVVAAPGGGFYEYDSTACAIYRESGGETSVFAGTPGTCGNTGDGGPANAATLDNSPSTDPATRTILRGPGSDAPTPMTVGPDGSVYFVQISVVGWVDTPGIGSTPEFTSQVRRITPDGTIDTLGTPITDSAIECIAAITTTPSGEVLVATFDASGTSRIEWVQPDGTRTPLATTDTYVYTIAAISDTELAAASFDQVLRIDLATGASTPVGVSTTGLDASVAAAPDGTIYVGSSDSDVVERVTADGVVTIAGDGTPDPANSRQYGQGTDLHLTPTGLALTPGNGLLICSGHVVYRLENPAAAGPGH